MTMLEFKTNSNSQVIALDAIKTIFNSMPDILKAKRGSGTIYVLGNYINLCNQGVLRKLDQKLTGEQIIEYVSGLVDFEIDNK